MKLRRELNEYRQKLSSILDICNKVVAHDSNENAYLAAEKIREIAMPDPTFD